MLIMSKSYMELAKYMGLRMIRKIILQKTIIFHKLHIIKPIIIKHILKLSTMNHLEKTFSDMQNSCISFVRDNESVWITNLVIKEDVEALEKNKKELDETVKAQKDSDPGGQIAQKKKDFVALAKK